MKARRTDVTLIYTGTMQQTVDAVESGGTAGGQTWADIIGEWDEFTYTDPAEGEADSIDISIFDRTNEWLNKKLPELGAEVSASITTQYWGDLPGAGTLDCGKFILDDFSFSGWPTSGKVSAVSTPADTSFRETEKSKVWNNVTLQKMGEEITGNAGIALVWDVETEFPAMKSVEQTEETDCSFFQGKCEEYGLCIKLYSKKLVVYDREAYKKKDAAATLTMADVKSWNWQKTLAHTYTGGTFTYTQAIKGAKDKKIKVEVGGGTRILHKTGSADSKADAELKLKAAINNANHSATTMSCTMIGRTDLVSTMCVNMEGFGQLSGKYYIDKVTHSVSASGGYETSLEMSKVEEESGS